jgi:WD40 repeat protein
MANFLWSSMVLTGVLLFAGCSKPQPPTTADSPSAETTRSRADLVPGDTAKPAPGAAIKVAKVPKKGRVKEVLTIRTLRFSPDGKWLVAAYKVETSGAAKYGLSGLIHIYDVARKTIIKKWSTSEIYLDAVFIGPNQIALGSKGVAQVWDWKSSRLLKTIEDRGAPEVLTLSPSGKLLAVGFDIYRLNPWKRQFATIEGGSFLTTTAFSPDESKIAVAIWETFDGVSVYDVKSGQELWTGKEVGESIGDVVWSPNGRIIASATSDGLRLLNARNGKILRTLPQEYVSELNFVNHGQNLIGISDEQLVVHRVRSGRTSQIIKFPPGSSNTISPDGRLMAQVTDVKVQFKKLNVKF